METMNKSQNFDLTFQAVYEKMAKTTVANFLFALSRNGRFQSRPSLV